ncbi:(2Fe-2S)-binding protein [Thaumasiovibrio subtropicus]|uniref:(2Fe-2S)-binding protein n=1 Tax=Thaumasiovibrio subtropicus TaxID=1891207 RepID=UPI000B34DEA9|nr:(2Fe-2S)-binding protein [Thaumasiovibrio subtropicus]
MYVCICHGISDKTITKLAIERSAYDVKTIRQITPLGSQCGKCIRMTKDILQGLKSEAQLPKVS